MPPHARAGRPEEDRHRYEEAPLRAEGAAGDRSEELRLGTGSPSAALSTGCAGLVRSRRCGIAARPAPCLQLLSPLVETLDILTVVLAIVFTQKTR